MFGESWFGHYAIIWMFCERQTNTKINHFYERALGEICNDEV